MMSKSCSSIVVGKRRGKKQKGRCSVFLEGGGGGGRQRVSQERESQDSLKRVSRQSQERETDSESLKRESPGQNSLKEI